MIRFNGYNAGNVLITGGSINGASGTNTFALAGPFSCTGINYQQPATGAAIGLANSDYMLILDPAAAIGSATITLAASPVNGQVIKLSSSQAITAVAIAAGANTIKNAITTLAAGAVAEYTFRSTGTTWFRSG